MKIFTSTIILTIAFLSAGAFAGNEPPTHAAHANVTVVFKNQLAPTKADITARICKLNFCREA